MQTRPNNPYGFTVVEILVSVAIIGVISTFAVSNLVAGRQKAQEAAAQADVRAMVSAINLLGADTGKWPNGCPIEDVANPEVYLNNAQAGLVSAPTVGDQGGGCEWVAADIAKWNGPYIANVTDSWGNGYYFDPDYTPYQGCSTKTTGEETVTVLSFGPNGVGPNEYDCDDIFFHLR